MRQLHAEPLKVIWDNAPAPLRQAQEWRGGERLSADPELGLRVVNLPSYSPDFNGDEAIWGWAREEAAENLCLGSKAAVQERVGNFLAGLFSRKTR